MQPWTNKIGHCAQIGGVETAILDNGAGRGVRIAWINTGTGLRYKVVLDRAMDIAEAFYNQHSLAWLSHSGITPPQRFTDQGLQWLRTFNGGLLVTCGLSHVGGPEEDAFGQRGLHGLISNTPAEIESIIQPDPVAGKLDFSITGLMRETTVFGPSLELRRTISGTLGQAQIRIHDEVTNRANTPAPHMLLYHLNFGWPLVDEGTKLLWEGSWQAREGGINAATFNDQNDFKTCPAPLDSHLGTGEAVAIIDSLANESGECIAGLYNEKLGLSVSVKFRKAQLPWLINWQHWGQGEYVTGLEPSTNPLVGQAQARAEKTLIFIEPGISKAYDLVIDVMNS